MRYSTFFCPTLKEAPREAEVVSHQLMLRAGMIRKVASGIYTYLPLGLRVFRKFEEIVREEMNAVGGLELLFPSVVPAELWQRSGRWDKYGPELLRFRDRKEADFCYGPTHEEVVTDLAAQVLKSYKQLPLMVYQIQSKFRDEIRPRFGVMRGREFVMKDAYSFHASVDSLKETYEAVSEAYKRIFSRAGLAFSVVDADSGAMGGNLSAEFMVLAHSGEDAVMTCQTCGYAANLEASQCRIPMQQDPGSTPRLEKVATPGKTTIKSVSSFMQVSQDEVLKTVLYEADNEPLMVLLQGSQSVNEIKLQHAIGAETLRPMPDTVVTETLALTPGYLGPVALNGTIRIIADGSICENASWITGANAVDAHFKNAVLGRDFEVADIFDIRDAKAGDPCPRCEAGVLTLLRGIEVGHIFQLGNAYSKSMSATVLNANGKAQHPEMGCYGIGIARTVAAAIEQHADEKGLVWPEALAPFRVIIVLTNVKKDGLRAVSDALYKRLLDAGIDVLYDDRLESPGAKFKDADLLGIPFQIIVGKVTEADGCVEIVRRRDGAKMERLPEDVVAAINSEEKWA